MSIRNLAFGCQHMDGRRVHLGVRKQLVLLACSTPTMCGWAYRPGAEEGSARCGRTGRGAAPRTLPRDRARAAGADRAIVAGCVARVSSRTTICSCALRQSAWCCATWVRSADSLASAARSVAQAAAFPGLLLRWPRPAARSRRVTALTSATRTVTTCRRSDSVSRSHGRRAPADRAGGRAARLPDGRGRLLGRAPVPEREARRQRCRPGAGYRPVWGPRHARPHHQARRGGVAHQALRRPRLEGCERGRHRATHAACCRTSQ